jgi:hypothetical protein
MLSIYKIKKGLIPIKIIRPFIVDLLGFEPRKSVPKTGVLPLHHRSMLFQSERKGNYL